MKRSDVELRRAVRIYRRAVIGRNAHDEMTEDARMRMATALWDASKDSALTPQAREFFEAMHGSLDGHAQDQFNAGYDIRKQLDTLARVLGLA